MAAVPVPRNAVRGRQRSQMKAAIAKLRSIVSWHMAHQWQGTLTGGQEVSLIAVITILEIQLAKKAPILG